MASRVGVALSVLATFAVANQQTSLAAESAEQQRNQPYIRRHDVTEGVALQIGAAGEIAKVSTRIAEVLATTAAGTEATCVQHDCKDDRPVKKDLVEVQMTVLCEAEVCDELCCEATTTCASMNTPCDGDLKNKGTEHTCTQETMEGGATAQCDPGQCCEADWTHKSFEDYVDDLKHADSSEVVGSAQERLQDTSVCKEVNGLTVVDRRTPEDLFENTTVTYAKGLDTNDVPLGKDKQCGSQFTYHLGNFTNGRLQFCAQAVANASICDSRFQMHKETYRCDCVVTWADGQCGDQDDKWANDAPETCIYELNPVKR